MAGEGGSLLYWSFCSDLLKFLKWSSYDSWPKALGETNAQMEKQPELIVGPVTIHEFIFHWVEYLCTWCRHRTASQGGRHMRQVLLTAQAPRGDSPVVAKLTCSWCEWGWLPLLELLGASVCGLLVQWVRTPEVARCRFWPCYRLVLQGKEKFTFHFSPLVKFFFFLPVLRVSISVDYLAPQAMGSYGL